MKLIQQSFEILEQKDFSLVGIKKFIERCARVSYKSEDRITENSYEKFVGMLESRDHSRPLEFGTVHLRLSDAQFIGLQTLLMDKVYNDYWVKYNIIDYSDMEAGDEENCYVTTNYRYYLEMCKYAEWLPEHLDPTDSDFYPKRYTVHMILSRGVMDEFRTHVGLSHLAESTRYCNYSKDKFDNEVSFIIPNWVNTQCFSKEYEESSYTDQLWHSSMELTELNYKLLLDNGWKPQQAREVLPLSVKSELISCGFADAWYNFFYRRDAKDAHPMAREIAKPMHEEFVKQGFIGE